jgi:hypothetical protein
MAKPDFNMTRDVPASMVSALATDAPLTLRAMQERSQGKDEYENGSAWSDTVRRMNLPPSDPQHISDENDLLPLVNNGLTMKGWRDAKELMGKEDERKKFMEMGMHQLSSSTAMNIDGEGDRRAYEWYVAANKYIDSSLADGKKLSDLLAPDSPNYVLNKVPARAESLDRQAENLAAKYRNNLPGAPLPADQKRQPNESPEDYIKRRGL